MTQGSSCVNQKIQSMLEKKMNVDGVGKINLSISDYMKPEDAVSVELTINGFESEHDYFDEASDAVGGIDGRFRVQNGSNVDAAEYIHEKVRFNRVMTHTASGNNVFYIIDPTQFSDRNALAVSNLDHKMGLRIDADVHTPTCDYTNLIPDVVDFGVLTQPSDNTVDSYKSVDFSVEATKIEGLDAASKQISVYVKDENATQNGDQYFRLTNKNNSDIKFSYDAFDVAPSAINETTAEINRGNMTSPSGFFLHGFTTEGELMDGSLRIKQVQLCDHQLSDLVVNYSGYMVFTSVIEDQ